MFKNGSLQGQACGNCEESSDSIMNKDIGAAMTNVAIVATASSASLAFLSCKKDGDNESHALLIFCSTIARIPRNLILRAITIMGNE